MGVRWTDWDGTVSTPVVITSSEVLMSRTGKEPCIILTYKVKGTPTDSGY